MSRDWGPKKLVGRSQSIFNFPELPFLAACQGDFSWERAMQSDGWHTTPVVAWELRKTKQRIAFGGSWEERVGDGRAAALWANFVISTAL